MATVTLRSGVASTTNNAALASASFTPTAGELLVVVAMHSGLVTDPAVTASANGITFTKVLGPILKAASVDEMSVFVANQLVPASPVAMTCTTTPSASTGGLIFVFSVTAMSRTGASAVRQSASQANQAASTTPAPVLGAAALTGNALIGAVHQSQSPPALTPPTGWTETATIGDIGHNTPANGGEVAFINSGFTGTTVTWGSVAGSTFASAVLELDTSAVTASSAPNQRARAIRANLVR